MLKPYYKRPEYINYLSLEGEEGIGVDELEILHMEPTPNVLDLSEIIPEPTGNALKGKCRKGVVHWTEDCEKAFNSLKQALASKPVLHSPDYNRQFILQTDASDNGIGVVLSQVTEDDK
ncbi:hypothetical protein AVEN_120559-1 [Araneus ventricosus]|uniref:Reverse transcriptase/retrotransposon-derived protein RNase H-like domain-containing protein n=1 Tax=Araneus ventricosus TaxID=182803 RepID=A0A4Y2HDQ3_ARAVE|nr:hypothetical protein AVEN_120559-1 [Araneus ventricosus]